MFETHFSFESSSDLPSSISEETAINLLHDFATIIHLNPECIGFKLQRVVSNQTSEYQVQDNISFIPKKLWSGGVWYTCIFTQVPNGCDITIKAPGGFTSINRWRISHTPEDKTVVVIESDARCSKTFAGFVKKFIENSHKQQQKAFRNKLEAPNSRPGMLRRRSSWPDDK